MRPFGVDIEEKTRVRIRGLPKRINFSSYVRRAINVFLDELERNTELKPENFSIRVIEQQQLFTRDEEKAMSNVRGAK